MGQIIKNMGVGLTQPCRRALISETQPITTFSLSLFSAAEGRSLKEVTSGKEHLLPKSILYASSPSSCIRQRGRGKMGQKTKTDCLRNPPGLSLLGARYKEHLQDASRLEMSVFSPPETLPESSRFGKGHGQLSQK